ncbi:MAG: hypothetical protein WCS01_10485 [bacterium]
MNSKLGEPMKKLWPLLAGAVAAGVLLGVYPKEWIYIGPFIAVMTYIVSLLAQGRCAAEAFAWSVLGVVVGGVLGKVITGDVVEMVHGGPIPAEYNIRLDLVWGLFTGGFIGASVAACLAGYLLEQRADKPQDTDRRDDPTTGRTVPPEVGASGVQ